MTSQTTIVGQPLGPGDLQDRQPDHPGAEDQQRVAIKGLHALQHIGGDGVGLDQCGLIETDRLGQPVGVGGGNADLMGEAAVAVHAEHFEPGADIGPADATRVALAAVDHRVDAHAIADAMAVDAIAHRLDDAGEFMASDSGKAHEGVLAVDDMHVRATDAGEGDLDQHFAGSGVGGSTSTRA